MKKYFFIIFFLLGFFFAERALASDFLFTGAPAEIYQGDEIKINLIVDAGEKTINTVGGRVIIPINYFSVKEIIDGDSGINFWVEKPTADASGEIIFSGIVPGGWSGRLNVFSAILSANTPGEAELQIVSTTALLNDGLGTADEVNAFGARLKIIPKTDGRSPLAVALDDNEPPEIFYPEIISSLSIYGGRQALIFSTADKKSGLDRYEIMEKKIYRFAGMSVTTGNWKEAKSPYLLKDQKLQSEISIKAIDRRGNVRLAIIAPSSPIFWYENILFWGIILLLALIIVALFSIYAKRRKI